MTEQANAFKLGLFVVVAVTLLFAGLVTLGAGAFLRRTVSIETYFVEAVQGLDVGAAVKHRGVQIGRVSRIIFANERYDIPEAAGAEGRLAGSFVLVDLELDERFHLTDLLVDRLDSAVTAGLRVRLASAGLMGVVFVELVLVDPERNPPPDIFWTPELPYVPATRSVIGTIADTIESLAGTIGGIDADGLIERIEHLVRAVDSKVDELDVVALQQHALALLDEVRGSNRQLQEILGAPEIRSAIDDLSATASNVRRITTDAEDDLLAFVRELPKIADSAQGAVDRITAFVDDPELKRLIESLANTADAAGPAATEARLLLRRLNVIVATQQEELDALVVGLRQLVDSANSLVDDAQRNPARLLFGEPPPPVNPDEVRQGGRR